MKERDGQGRRERGREGQREGEREGEVMKCVCTDRGLFKTDSQLTFSL